MKQRFLCIKVVLTMMLCAFVQGAWASFGGGSGTEADPYLISHVSHWKTLVTYVNNGGYNGFKGKHFELLCNIDISETRSSGKSAVMVGLEGKDDTKFSGFFDGNGHTITLDITDKTGEDFCAPFRFLKNATVMNLNVAGKIKRDPEYGSHPKNAGGLVGRAEGNNTIINCRCSATVEVVGNSDASSGGFIGELREGGTTTMTNCVFDGQLVGWATYCWGGFVGYVAKDNTVTFNNCLFTPSFTQVDTSNKYDNSRTFARSHKDGKVNVKNCYYTTLINEAQGATDVREYSPEQLQAALGNEWKINGSKVQPRLKFHTFEGAGTEESPYLITSAADWRYLASNSNKGERYKDKCFLLANDITAYRVVSLYNNFMGIFDGGGHTLTFNYYNTEGIEKGLFKLVEGATFKNLNLTGEITVKVACAGGLIGVAAGNTTITNCRSSITINCTYEGDNGPLAQLANYLYGRNYSGFVGDVASGKTVFTGCVFDGMLKGVEGSPSGYSAGFVGTINTDNAEVEFNDCVTDGIYALDLNTCNTFVQGGTAGTCKFNNSYYTAKLADTFSQGKFRHTITADEGITVEVAGKATEYEVSGITSYGTGVLYHMRIADKDYLYAGEGETMRLNLGYDCPSGYSVEYTVNEGTLSGNDNPYTLTMSDFWVKISATLVKSTPPADITLVDGADNSEVLARYDGQAVNVEYDRVLSAVDNGDGTWMPRCYTICLPYDFDLYKYVESGQASLYRLKYIDTEKNEFIFTNDFGYASSGMAWLLVVNYGTVGLNATNVKISAQPKALDFAKVYDYRSQLEQPENPKVAGYWTGVYDRIHDDEVETMYVYGMQSDGSWQRCVVTDQGPKWSWIETFRGIFLSIEPLETDTFKPMFTFTGAGDDEETGEIEAFPIANFEGDLFHDDATRISPAIRTIEADGSSRFFDLQGRQIKGKPVRGIYIQDGKKRFSK